MNNNRIFLYGLITIFIASIFSNQVQSSWGKVSVQGIKIPTQNGQWVVADLFKPKSATTDNLAPLVIIIPGFQRSKETLSNISIELSRRGIVVIAIDPYAQGGSSSSMSTRAATKEGYGMFAIVDYVYNTSNLNYVDKNRIGATGHSAGGLASIRGAQYFGKKSQKSGLKSKLHSVYVSGMIRMGFEKKHIKKIRSNVGISYALYDEGAWQNELENGDMRTAPEAIRLVNMAISESDNSIDSIKIGHFYGNIDNRTLRVVHNEKLLHPFQPYSHQATINQLDYFLKVFEVKDPISPKNQIWYWKELLTFISLIASFLMIIPIAEILLNIPFFQSLKTTIPEALPNPKGIGKTSFWIFFMIGSMIACFSFIPMSELSKTLFSDASARHQTWFFPQRMNNAVMLWAIFNGCVGFILFFINYYFFGKNHGVNPSMWGYRTNKMELGRTFLLAFSIFTVYFMILYIIYYMFHVDYRFIFIGVRVFRPVMLSLLPIYIPLFFIFFLSNSLRVNGALRFKDNSGWSNLLMAALSNTLGLILILTVQYLVLAFTGTVYWTSGWLYINLLFAIIPIMFILPYFNRYFFKMTGKIYLGPMTMCLIFIMILLSNTVCYIPL